MTGDFLLKDFKGSQLKRSSSSIWSGDHTLGKVISDRQIMVCSTEFPSLNWHFLHRCCVCVGGGGGLLPGWGFGTHKMDAPLII